MEANLHIPYSEAEEEEQRQLQEEEEEEEEEDYINMEVDNYRIFRQSSKEEFEFQSFSSSSERDHTTTSPADELFYMGKLLPLHIPPRLEMVQKVLQDPPSFNSCKTQQFQDDQDQPFSTPLFTPTSNTPFESCNVSPSESCQVTRELCPEEYFLDYLQQSEYQEKRSWTKRPLKLIKQSSSIGSKLKWAKYLKSLFAKSSGCSDEYSAAASNSAANQRPLPKGKKDSNLVEDIHNGGGHRRSFSGAFKRLSKTQTSPSSISSISSSSAANLNRQVFKRSSSCISELENPIQAAIAHCKRSQQQQQQQLYSREVAKELAFCSSRVIYDDQERARLCRG